MSAEQHVFRAAIVGAGNIGRTHADAYRAAGARVVGVADVSPDRAAALAGETGAHPFEDVDEMLDVLQPDVVSVCTPPSHHRAPALAALGRGIPILCEKPLAATLEAAREICAAASQAGAVCMTGFCHRFHEPVLQVKERLEAGAIGTSVLFRNRFAYRFENVAQSWFSDPTVSGGGTLMDTSVHSIDLYRFLVGEITQVAVQLTTTTPGLSVEDDSVLLVNGPAGVPGIIEASWTTPIGNSILTIFGTEGNLTVDYEREGFGVAILEVAGQQPEEFLRTGRDRFADEVRHLLQALTDGTPVYPDAADGVRTLEVIDAAQRAARSGGGAPVPL
jgi:predicted dehydrogenase